MCLGSQNGSLLTASAYTSQADLENRAREKTREGRNRSSDWSPMVDKTLHLCANPAGLVGVHLVFWCSPDLDAPSKKQKSLKFRASEMRPEHFSVNRDCDFQGSLKSLRAFLSKLFSGLNFTSAHKSWSDQYETSAHTFWHLHLNHFFSTMVQKKISIFKTGAKCFFSWVEIAHTESYIIFLSCVIDTYYFTHRRVRFDFCQGRVSDKNFMNLKSPVRFLQVKLMLIGLLWNPPHMGMSI